MVPCTLSTLQILDKQSDINYAAFNTMKVAFLFIFAQTKRDIMKLNMKIFDIFSSKGDIKRFSS